MRRFDPRLWLGILLVFGGLLALLDAMDIISNVGGIFWGLVWGAAGVFFLRLLTNNRENWWAAFPAFTFLGLALQSFLPDSLSQFDGLAFFAGLSLAFWWVYATDMPGRWWAIIPGGVLFTLGVVSSLENLSGMDGGGIFFLGLGLTFVLVALLPGGSGRSWALIPGTILVLFGALLSTPFGGDLTDYIWPLILIILGGFFVLRFFKDRSLE